MEKFFKNKEDIYKYTYGFGKKVKVICPDCVREKIITIKDLYNHKSIGCVCGDGVSYPEKFIYSLLKQLDINFVWQYAPDWIKPRLYDFYLPEYQIVIEADGGIGHGNKYTFNNKLMAKELLEIDKYKDSMANKHNIQVIRLDCNPSSYEQIIDEIRIKLIKIIKDKNIDFSKCHEFGLSNFTKIICDYKNENQDITVNQFAEIFKISNVTIRTYLKNGTILGWCNYNPEIEKEKRRLRGCKKIDVYLEDKFIGTFESCKAFSDYLIDVKKIKNNSKSISNALKIGKSYKGFNIYKHKEI